MALAGRKALVKATGAAIAFTGEACTLVTANTVFQITNVIKRVWDPTVAIVVKKDAVIQAATLYTINRLNGRITFLADIGGGHTITVDGSYLPVATLIEGKGYHWELTADYPSRAQFGDIFVPRSVLCLRDGKGNVQSWRTTDETMLNMVLAGALCVFEFYDDASLPYDLRLWGVPTKESWDAAVNKLVDQNFEFECSADIDGNVATNV